MSWKKALLKEDKGVGDTIERITTATGIKKAVYAINEITGTKCGCEKRKQKLNERFSYDR
tara:strand:- start:2613 stop:2792 length:180 start_codon:yes stop_codon:yes gene_type:complete